MERARLAPLLPPLRRGGGVRLTRAGAAAVRRAAGSGDWPLAYRTVAADLRASGADCDTVRWYANAAEINDAAATSFIHYFARLYLVTEVFRQTGLTIDPAGETVQACSDRLAAAVLGDVAEGRSDRVGDFGEVGPFETMRVTRRLVPGLVLDRTVWPAYAQLAWAEADRRVRGWFGRFLPFWRRGLPRWTCPAETFEDGRFLRDLTAGERASILASAGEAHRRARACVRAKQWVSASGAAV